MKYIILVQAIAFFTAMFTMAAYLQGWVSPRIGEIASGVYLILWGLFVCELLAAAAWLLL